jgi:hypothetical protein
MDLAKFLVMRKGGGGKVAINPDLVTHIRSANGAFTDVFFEGQQVAVEGAFEDVVRQLSAAERRAPSGAAAPRADDASLVFGRVER